MQFSEIRTELNELHMDTSSEWASNGTLAKKCVNKGYEYLYDLLKNSGKIKPYITSVKTKLTFVDKTASLPVNFDTIDVVSYLPFTDESDTDVDLNDNRFYDFRIVGQRGAKTMQLEDHISELYIRYIPVRADMTADADIPVLPYELHRSIADFALVEYYRRIRDNVEASNSLNLAQGILNEKLARL